VEAKQAITGSDPPPNTVSLLQRLEATHEKLSQQAEELYASLNISGSFPELENLPRAFVHTLLILHDLKVVIRRRAIASFQEWEALDRAVGGRREPLGMLWSLRLLNVANGTKVQNYIRRPEGRFPNGNLPSSSSSLNSMITAPNSTTSAPLNVPFRSQLPFSHN
jgi:hypothetical protein